MKKRLIARIMIICMLVSMVNMTACGNGEAAASVMTGGDTGTLLEVDVVSPLVTDVMVEGEYVGVLEYENQVSVAPMLSGEVTAAYFEEGDYVEAGELLFTLDDEAYQLQLQNAQIAYEQAQSGIDSQLGQLQMGRDSAANSLYTAQEGISQLQDSYDYFNSQIADLDQSHADLAEDRAEMKEDLLEIRDQISNAEKAVESAAGAYSAAYAAYVQAQQQKIAQDLAQTSGSALGGTVSGGSVSDDSVSGGSVSGGSLPAMPTELITDSQLAALKQASEDAKAALSNAQSTLTALKSAESQLETAIAQYDSSMESMDSSKEGLIYQRDNLNYSMEQAQRGEALAQEQLDYYDSYTIPSAQVSGTTTLEQARLGIASAQLQLEYTRVTAPVSGTIMAKNVEELGLAQAGYAAYVIISDDGAIASFGVPENTYRMLSQGQEVAVERNGVVYEGSIVELPLQVNPQTGLFTIKAALKGDTDELIMGTSVKVMLTTQHADQVLTIPIDCVYYESGEAYTYVLEGDTVRKISIETGLYDDENMQILDGITEDMMIITTWSNDLRDGLTVRVSDPAVTADTVSESEADGAE